MAPYAARSNGRSADGMARRQYSGNSRCQWQHRAIKRLLVVDAFAILAGSTAGSTGARAFSAYGASKAAIRSLAQGWALDLALRRIRVNTLVPSSTSTPSLHGMFHTEEEKQQRAAAMEAPRLLTGWPNPEKSPPQCYSLLKIAAAPTAASCFPTAARHTFEEQLSRSMLRL